MSQIELQASSMSQFKFVLIALFVLGFVPSSIANTVPKEIEFVTPDQEFLDKHIAVCNSILSGKPAFQQYVHILTKKMRRGFQYRGVPDHDGETIWQHVQMVAKASKILAQRRGLDIQKMTFIAIVHDLAEAIANDYIPADNIPKQMKHQEEWMAINIIIDRIRLDDPVFAEKVFEAWKDYEFKRTHEARLVKQLDKMDAAIRASIAEKQGYQDLQEFYVTPFEHLEDPLLIEHLQEFIQFRHAIDDPYEWHLVNLK